MPRGKANQLSAFMAARMDGENYGKLVSYEIPTTLVAPSPAQAGTLVESDPDISSTLSLIDQRGSAVLRGNVQLIPVGKSIIYARPDLRRGPGRGAVPPVCGSSRSRTATSAVLVDFAGEGQIRTVDDGIRQLLAQPRRARRRARWQRIHERPTNRAQRDDHRAPTTTTTTVPLSTGNVQTAAPRRRRPSSRPPTRRCAAGDLGGYQSHVEQAKKSSTRRTRSRAGG